MRNMMRCAMGLILACILGTGLAQRPAPMDDLATLLRSVPEHPDADSLLLTQIIDRLQSAPLPEVAANLPTLMSMTEAPQEDVRSFALLALMNMGFASAGPAQVIPAMPSLVVQDVVPDNSAVELLVPYIPKLLCLLSRGTPMDRELSFSVVQEVSRLKPVPPTLMTGLMRLLTSKQSTLPLPTVENQLKAGTPADGPALGPELLWILLPAGASYYQDPRTKITEGWDTPEVQEAVSAFLEREDQTPSSLVESVRALAMALPQNPKVNADLVKLLDSPSAEVQLALVQQLPKITLTSDAFFVGRARVQELIDDPNTTAEVRSTAAQMLPCWSNDRHHGSCPAVMVAGR
jgi:hypothetical protein